MSQASDDVLAVSRGGGRRVLAALRLAVVLIFSMPSLVAGIALGLDAAARLWLAAGKSLDLPDALSEPLLYILMSVPLLSLSSWPLVAVAGTTLMARSWSNRAYRRAAWCAFLLSVLGAIACVLATFAPGYLELP